MGMSQGGRSFRYRRKIISLLLKISGSLWHYVEHRIAWRMVCNFYEDEERQFLTSRLTGADIRRTRRRMTDRSLCIAQAIQNIASDMLSPAKSTFLGVRTQFKS